MAAEGAALGAGSDSPDDALRAESGETETTGSDAIGGGAGPPRASAAGRASTAGNDDSFGGATDGAAWNAKRHTRTSAALAPTAARATLGRRGRFLSPGTGTVGAARVSRLSIVSGRFRDVADCSVPLLGAPDEGPAIASRIGGGASLNSASGRELGATDCVTAMARSTFARTRFGAKGSSASASSAALSKRASRSFAMHRATTAESSAGMSGRMSASRGVGRSRMAAMSCGSVWPAL